MTKIIIPDTIFGDPVDGAIDRVLAGAQQNKPVIKPIINPIQIGQIDNPENWIMLEEKTYENYSYPDMLINSARIAYNPTPEFQTASQKLGTLQNTSKDSLGRDFIGNINWEKAMKLNLLLGNKNIPPRMFIDFLSLLYEGVSSSKKVYNASGKILDSKFCEQIYDDITKVQSPYRAEFLNADFKYDKKKLYIEYEHKLDSSGNLIAGKREELSDWLDEDKIPGINLNSLFKTANKHGLPTNKTKLGDLHYYCPDKDNNSVSGFGAGSDWTSLYCGRGRSNADSELGVRACREATAGKI